MNDAALWRLAVLAAALALAARRLPALAVGRPVAFAVLQAAVLVAAVPAVRRAALGLQPESARGRVTVITVSRGGLPPDDVERRITRPIEAALAGATRLRHVFSSSSRDRSAVTLEFEAGTDMEMAALEVRESFLKVKSSLPPDIEKPVIARYDEGDAPVFVAALTSSRRSPEELRRIAEQSLRDRLLRAPGAAHVRIEGGRERKILVELDRDRLIAQRLPLPALLRALEKNNLNLKAGEAGTPSALRFGVRTAGAFRSLEEIAAVAVAVTPDGAWVRLRDVARVRDAFLESESVARLNSGAAVMIYVQKEARANAVRTCSALEAIVRESQGRHGPDVELLVVSSYKEETVSCLRRLLLALAAGLGLAALVFAGWYAPDPRPAACLTAAILTAGATGLAFIAWEKIAVNVFSVCGLVLAMVPLFFQIPDLWNRARPQAAPALAATAGAESAATAVAADALAMMAALVPFLFVREEVRALVFDMVASLAAGCCSSLWTTLTLVPFLTARMLPLRAVGRGRSTTRVRRFLTARMNAALSRSRACKTAVGAACLLALAAAGAGPKGFLQPRDPDPFLIAIELEPGVRLEHCESALRAAEEAVRGCEETRGAVRSLSAEGEGGSGKIWVGLRPGARAGEVMQALRPRLEKSLAAHAGAYGAFFYFSQPGGGSDVEIDVFGPEDEPRAELAGRAAQALATIPGLSDVRVHHRPGRPELRLLVDAERAAPFGLDAGTVAETLHGLMRGLRATALSERGAAVETVVRLDPVQRETLAQLLELPILGAGGRGAALGQVARREAGLAPSHIWRKDRARAIRVSARLERGWARAARKKINTLLKKIVLPSEYYLELGGACEDMAAAERDIAEAVGLGLFLCFAVLAARFQSARRALAVLAEAAPAAAGGCAALALLRIPLTLETAVGLLALAALAAGRCAAAREGAGGGEPAAPPLMLGWAASVCALLPMAWEGSRAAQLWAPLARPLIAGLVCLGPACLFSELRPAARFDKPPGEC